MSYINKQTKKDYILSLLAGKTGRKSYREWAKELGVKAYEVSNALYNNPDLQKRYITLERNRVVHKMPLKEILGKLAPYAPRSLTCKEMATILGYTEEQIRSLLRYPEIAGYYIRKSNAQWEDVKAKISEHYLGEARFLSDWVSLTGYKAPQLLRWNEEIKQTFGDILLDKTEWRISEINRLAGQLTLTEWSEYFGIDITAMHHFFTRKNLHHLRRNPPTHHS